MAIAIRENRTATLNTIADAAGLRVWIADQRITAELVVSPSGRIVWADHNVPIGNEMGRYQQGFFVSLLQHRAAAHA